jgi:hypothetical protein
MSKLNLDQKWRLWSESNAERQELIKSSIRSRWVLPHWDIEFPWWRDPSPVRILIYAEGREITFIRQLQYVTTLLQSRPYFYVDFKITTAHRNFRGAGASIEGPRRLDDPELDILNRFDEIWFFGFGNQDNLEKAEVELLRQFMNAPKFGGVLVTGDHENRGKSIAGQIPRAGAMRLYPAPKARRPGWNNSLVEGPDPNKIFDPNDQADDVPQRIAFEFFPVKSLPGLKQVHRPHPVLCGSEGPIDVLPDHQHEGEAIAPHDLTGNDWPEIDDHQERPVVIALGKTKESDAGNRVFGVLSAYDGHNVGVGRIVADSSWHHWFDRNLTGIPQSEIYKGFDDSPGGKKFLKQFDTFFLNCGAWLAPPARQREMRLTAWWSILFTDDIAELSIDEPLWSLGEQAISALTQHASIGMASDWIFDSVFADQRAKTDLARLSKNLGLDVSLEQQLAGGILRSLMKRFSSPSLEAALPLRAPSDEILEKAINDGVIEAIRFE